MKGSIKGLMLVMVAMLVGGCVSASTSNKVCADLGAVSKAVTQVSESAGKAIADYTPKKCLNAGVSGDTGKLTGGVTAGVSNE